MTCRRGSSGWERRSFMGCRSVTTIVVHRSSNVVGVTCTAGSIVVGEHSNTRVFGRDFGGRKWSTFNWNFINKFYF